MYFHPFFMTIYLVCLLFLLKLSHVNNIFFCFHFPIILKLFLKVLPWNFYCNDNKNSSNKLLMPLMFPVANNWTCNIHLWKVFLKCVFFNCFKTWIPFVRQSLYLLNHCHSNKLTGKLILSQCIKVTKCANYYLLMTQVFKKISKHLQSLHPYTLTFGSQ